MFPDFSGLTILALFAVVGIIASIAGFVYVIWMAHAVGGGWAYAAGWLTAFVSGLAIGHRLLKDW